MIKFRIHGRGGQGGVTLAKLIAFTYWTKGSWVQAFGSYSAERTGAPLLAFALVDDNEITNRSMVYYPDHLIVIDDSLLKESILSGLKEDGIIIIDANNYPRNLNLFSGHKIALIDAKKIARKYGLGTFTTPITNTTILGAIVKIFDLDFSYIKKTIEALRLSTNNIDAALEAYESVSVREIPGKSKFYPVLWPNEPVPPLITGNIGSSPQLNVADWKSVEPFFSNTHVPPCNHDCPAFNDIQAFVLELTQNNVDRALEIIYQNSPLPAVTSRVCPHPCEENCNRKVVDERLNVHELERYAASHGKKPKVLISPATGKKVAIIGSGPAGLSAAYHLKRKGHAVTIFEALSKPGGMLAYGIPTYRLPRNILEDEISFIESLGVKINCNTPINTISEFNKLTKDFDAVIVAVGLSGSVGLELKGSEKINVLQGIDFLKKVNLGQDFEIGKKVVVVGGGNTAIDVARCAIRKGAEVKIAYRRTRQEMPAINEEIEDAIEEGVEIKFLVSPIEIVDGKYLLLQKMTLGEPDSTGRRKPVPLKNEFEKLELDTLILALGQKARLEFLDNRLIKDGFIETNSNHMTKFEKVFVAGDVLKGDGTVTHAIGSGQQTANYVHDFLYGIKSTVKEMPPPVTHENLNLYYFSPIKRKVGKKLNKNERTKSFEEVNLGLEDNSEALRCLSCGICNGCIQFNRGRCELFCPERAITRISATKLDINYKNCKGCLICMEVCPRHAIEKRPTRKE